MDFHQLTARALEVRALYAEWEMRRDGRSWSTSDLMNGLWSVPVLADAVGVDLEQAFTRTMDDLDSHVRQQLANT